jgi:hypothetical protein
MGCHLHDLMDCYEKETILGHLEFEKPGATIAEIIQLSTPVMMSAVCFDIGPWHGLTGFQMIPELCRLPYENCWFEGVAPGDGCSDTLIGIIAKQMTDGTACLWAFCKTNGCWTFQGMMVQTEVVKNDGTRWKIIPKMDDEHNEFMLSIARLMWVFLSALNCINVSRVEHKPDPKLVKARCKRGRRPLYSYWTLQLDLDRERSEPSAGGGSHSSPRLHLRRGHARQFVPGKWCWVQPHVVGSKSEGMIHKDYAVKQKEGGAGHGTN